MEPTARLKALSGEHGGVSYPLAAGETLIGRGEECALQIIDTRISRNHALLRQDGAEWVLEDLNSTHGTFVKGERVEKAILQHGDTITIGETILRFEDPSSQDSIPTQMVSPEDTPTVLDQPDGMQAEMPSADDIATVMDSSRGDSAGMGTPDEVVTVMASPDDVPTKLVSPDDQSAVMAVDHEREQPPQPAPPVEKAIVYPVVAAPAPPQSAPAPDTTGEKKPFPWKWVAIGGGLLVVVLIVGIGLTLMGGLIGDRQASDPEPVGLSDESIILTIEAQAEVSEDPTPLIPATLTPTLGAHVTTTQPLETPTETASESAPGPESGLLAVFGGSAQIAYASDRTGRPQIFIINLETHEEQQLTDLPGGACQPSWSADGGMLAFTSPCNSNREEYRGSTVFIMEVGADGNPGTSTPLIETVGEGDYDPAWERDGASIAFTSWRTGRPQVFRVAADGTNLINLNDDLAFNWAPTWSHDGTQLAFLTGRSGAEEIWTIAASGGEERRFSRSDGKNVERPDWSPDGLTLIFEKIVGNIPRLVLAPLADGGLREFQLCQSGQLSLQPMGEPAWSPDGEWLAFETWPDGANHEIGVMRANCTEYSLLTDGPGLEFDAAWRPAP